MPAFGLILYHRERRRRIYAAGSPWMIKCYGNLGIFRFKIKNQRAERKYTAMCATNHTWVILGWKKSIQQDTWVILVLPTSTAVLLRQQDNKEECAHCTNLKRTLYKIQDNLFQNVLFWFKICLSDKYVTFALISLVRDRIVTHPSPEAENSTFEYFIISKRGKYKWWEW